MTTAEPRHPRWHFNILLGGIDSEGKSVKEVRKQFRKEIKTVTKAKTIYLEWQSVTNQSGWWSDVPKSGLVNQPAKGHK